MTLKEKFMKLIGIPFKDKGVYIDINKVEECEKIADEFAIGFAEWIRNMSFGKYHAHSTKELLEIYKKEKGL
jgi:hypothetical protein